MTKVGFFKRIWLAISDFRVYPFSQKEKTSRAIWYFLRLVLLCALVISIFATKYIFNLLPDTLAKFNEKTPDFSIENGKLITDKDIRTEFDSNTFLVFSNKVNSNDILKIISEIKSDETIKKSYQYYVLILDDQASYVYDLDGAIYQALRIDYNNFEDTNKEEFINDFAKLEDSIISKIIVLFSITIIFCIVIMINRFITSIIYMITIFLINTVFALKLKLRNYIILVCYVSTLPIILETIAIIVTRQISSAVNMICTLVSFVYIFYALRAIKIDNILSGGTGNNPLEKIENAIKEAQEEIEEQLKEKADEDKKEEEKNKNSNEEQDKQEEKTEE